MKKHFEATGRKGIYHRILYKNLKTRNSAKVTFGPLDLPPHNVVSNMMQNNSVIILQTQKGGVTACCRIWVQWEKRSQRAKVRIFFTALSDHLLIVPRYSEDLHDVASLLWGTTHPVHFPVGGSSNALLIAAISLNSDADPSLMNKDRSPDIGTSPLNGLCHHFYEQRIANSLTLKPLCFSLYSFPPYAWVPDLRYSKSPPLTHSSEHCLRTDIQTGNFQ